MFFFQANTPVKPGHETKIQRISIAWGLWFWLFLCIEFRPQGQLLELQGYSALYVNFLRNILKNNMPFYIHPYPLYSHTYIHACIKIMLTLGTVIPFESNIV